MEGEIAARARELPGDLGIDIDTVFPPDAGAEARRLGPGNVADAAIGIDADIGDGAAAGFGPVADIAGIGAVVIAEMRVGMKDASDRALPDQRLRPLPLRVVDDHIGLGHQQARGIAGRDQPVDLIGLQRDGLFGQYMLSGGDGLLRPFDVKVVGQRDIDRLHRRIGQQGIIAAMDLKIGAERLEIVRLLRVRGRQRIKPCARRLMDRAGHVIAREFRRAQNAPVDRLHRAPLSMFAQS